MSHFRTILTIDGRRQLERRSTMFTVPSEVSPHEAEHVRVDVRRYFVGTVSVGEVASSGHDTFVTEPAGATLIVPRHGRIVSAEAGGVDRAAARGQALFFSPNRRFTRVEPNGAAQFVGIPLVVPRATLRKTAARLGWRPGTRNGLDSFGLSFSATASQEAQKTIFATQAVHAAVSNGDPRLANAKAHRSWCRLLSEQMIALLHAAGCIDLPAASDGRAASRHVRTALDYMDAHFADIVTIADVSDACGVGVRTLEASFREIWSQTPHQALTEIRLDAARRFLVDANRETSVTEAALTTGFSHLGRFSVAYRSRFDESPSETLRRAGRSDRTGNR